MKKYFVDMEFEHPSYGRYKIISCDGDRMYKILFLNTGYITRVRSDYLYSGKVLDRMFPSVFGVGVIGDVKTKVNGVHTKEYKLWSGMLSRCYSSAIHLRQPTYKDCEVSTNFKHLTYFEGWCSEQIGFGVDGYDLDKDVLVRGNKIYSEDTCAFIPREINSLFGKHEARRGECCIGVSLSVIKKRYSAHVCIDGVQICLGYYKTEDEAFQVYKQAKESNIQRVALKYKNLVDERVFTSLMEYVVNKGD